MNAQTVCSIIETETSQQVSESTPLDKLNVDSLEFLNLMMVISAEAGKELSDETIAKFKTVGDIVQALN